jgi:hypothetical protein
MLLEEPRLRRLLLNRPPRKRLRQQKPHPRSRQRQSPLRSRVVLA